MPFTKTFGTSDGSYADSTSWRLISLRNAGFSWTVSGSGTNEYYVRTAANANPGFQATPPTTSGVYINGSAATKGTLGALTAGQWGYGDNDTLGYSTVYVRLSDGTDPDSKDYDFVSFRQIPQATEHVRFAADSGSVTAGYSQAGIAIGDFIVEEGYAGTIGSASLGYLFIDPDRFEFNGAAECWLDIGSAAISPQIYGTGGAASGERGLYLRGSAIATLNIMGGQVGVASRPGETTTITTLRMLGDATSLWLGNGVTLTTLHQYGGEAVVKCGATTVILYGGRMTTQENGAFTTVTMHDGEYIYQSSGNITTFNLYGGTLDLQKSGAARTISTLNKYRGSSQVLHNKEAVTITTESRQETYTEAISF